MIFPLNELLAVMDNDTFIQVRRAFRNRIYPFRIFDFSFMIYFRSFIKYMMTFIKVLALFWHTRWTKPPRTVKMEASEMGAVMAWRISGFSG